MVRSDEPAPLEVEDLCVERGGTTVLDGIWARFERGDITTVVGPSGAGKTTLLRCLNRLEEPRSGRVLLDGRDVREVEPTFLRRKVGLILQTPVLFEGGVKGNLAYGLDGVETDRLERALDLTGLSASFLERDSSALSVGQAQRVCIARALMRDPEVLLMDEPTSALDKDAAAKIETLIVRIARGGLTVVLVTHNLDQARRVGDTALLLVRGRVVARGAPADIESAWDDEVVT